jgi:hypothetical protein
MQGFLQKCAACVTGVLHGFDRLRFRGTLRRIASAGGMGSFLACMHVLLKDAGQWMKQRSDEMEKASLKQADKLGRPVQYINDPSLRKEDVAMEIARRDGIEEGLVCVLTAVEVCNSFDIHRNHAKKILELVPRRRKCLHLYHYFQHPQLGLMHLRLQTWFPFNVWSCINGRHWLCRQLDQAGIGYRRRENCLLEVADLEQAQRLADTQVSCDFAALLDPLADLVHPLRRTLFENYPMDYYWSCQDSEFASDIMFKSEAELSRLYRDLIRHGTQNLNCNAVMRFLGRKASAGEVYRGNFKGQVVTDLKARPEGIRLKHNVNGNSIKMYNKQGSVLRIETTIVQPRDFKVFRGTEAQPLKRKWQKMRKGVADLPRRAEVSKRANERYASMLEAAHCTKPLKDVAEPLCQRIAGPKHPARALNPLSPQDALLLETVNRGEFAINGFRNRDVRRHLYPVGTTDPKEQKRRAAATTRQLRLLRAHGLINKVPKTHRYVLSDCGRQAITALLAARAADVPRLLQAA